MTLRFSQQPRSGSYLVPDEKGGWREVKLPVELRRDPLTGRSGRLAHFQGFRLHPADISEAVASSRDQCPFCPERVMQVTPLLPSRLAPQGRILKGEAVVFPNISPYDRHSVVVALTREHFVAPEGFTPRQLADGLLAAQQYFLALAPAPRGTYSLVTWNYMPPAGATQVHAHLQGFSTNRPGSVLEEEVRRSRSFFRRMGHPFWEELVVEERSRGQRFLGEGRHTAWMTAFVSRSVISDVLGVFPHRQSIEELSEEALLEFATGLAAAIRFFGQEGVVAFNLALYPAPQRERTEHFWLHARLSPRIYFMPSIRGSDTTSWQHLLDEPFMVRSPEVLAERLRSTVESAIA
ncbi:MAG: hypothetical protein ACYDEA_06275 [Candidatus Dormibacteria bacterium]